MVVPFRPNLICSIMREAFYRNPQKVGNQVKTVVALNSEPGQIPDRDKVSALFSTPRLVAMMRYGTPSEMGFEL
jgi:hypothetical protein